MAIPVRLPKFMIAICDSRAPKCVIYAKEDTPYMLEDKDPTPTQWEKLNSDPIIDAVSCKPAERHHDYVDYHEDVEELDELMRLDW